MKLIIAGTRDLMADVDLVNSLMTYFRLSPEEVVSGCGGNVDEAGEDWAATYLPKPTTCFVAKWQKHGVHAGPIRNREMAEYADALLLIWDGKSPGSASMKRLMADRQKPIYEVILRG